MTNEILNFANQFGTTNKLQSNPVTKLVKTVETTRKSILENLEGALVVLREGRVNTAKNKVARKVANGFAIKIGYGNANTKLVKFGQDENGKDIVERRFRMEETPEAIKYVEGVIAILEDGGLDQLIDAELLKLRARGKRIQDARRAKKAANNNASLYKVA